MNSAPHIINNCHIGNIARCANHRGVQGSNPVSRRDALRYAAAASAVAGLGAVSANAGAPTAEAATPRLIDFAMRQIPAEHIRRPAIPG